MTRVRVFLAAALCGLALAGPGNGLAEEAGAPAAEPTAESRLTGLLEKLQAGQAELEAARAQRDRATGEEQILLTRDVQDAEMRLGAIAHDLADAVLVADQDHADLGRARDAVIELIRGLPGPIERALKARQALAAEAARTRSEAPPENLLAAEQAMSVADARVTEALRFYERQVVLMPRLGLDAQAARTSLIGILTERADRSATRLKVVVDEQAQVAQQLVAAPDDAAAKVRQAALAERFKGTLAALRSSSEMLRRLGEDTTEYQKLLVSATGDVTAIGMDAGVVRGLLVDWLDAALDWLAENGLQIVGRVLVIALILLATWALSRVARRVTTRALTATGADISVLLEKMLVAVVGNLVLALGILIALAQFGISIGPMLAGLGIAGFIIGFALQDTLSNFASGVMILFYRPYDVGDVVEAAGISGQVSAMNLVSTTILTFDNQTLIVPNNKIWGDVIRNVTRQTQRRVDLKFGIGYADDVDHAERVLTEIVAAHPGVLTEPEPVIRLHELGESSVNFIVRPWCLKEDYWSVYWDITREVKRRFDAEGITIPFPQRDVHLYRAGPARAPDDPAAPDGRAAADV